MLDADTERDIAERAKAQWKGEPESRVWFTDEDLARMQREAIEADRRALVVKVEELPRFTMRREIDGVDVKRVMLDGADVLAILGGKRP